MKPGSRIVEKQPYYSFEGFLRNFGTDAKVVNTLIRLGAFENASPINYLKFYEHYKKWKNSQHGKVKRHEDSKERHHQKLYEQLHGMYPKGQKFPVGFDDDSFDQYLKDFTADEMKQLYKLRDAFFKFVETYAKKQDLDTEPKFEDFQPENFDLKPEVEKVLQQSQEQIEIEAYGFRWTHPLESSPDYDHANMKTYQRHRTIAEEAGIQTSYVEGYIEKLEIKTAKSGNTYAQVTMSDALGETNKINVWDDDFKRFDDMLIEGNLVKVMLDAPDNGFPTYKLHSPPRYLRHKLPPKNTDFRVVVYRKDKDEF